MKQSRMLVPPWLETLLNAEFFSICRIHGDAARSECNMFCLDCNFSPFCFYCRSSRHEDHRVIQIRRSSYHDVVRVAEIEEALDISGVQTYVINSARVMFLNERPQLKSGKGVSSHTCDICGRSLLDHFRFCSLGCKLEGIKRNNNGSFTLEATKMERTGGHSTSARKQEEGEGEEGEGRGSGEDIYAPTPCQPSSNPRRRKGIPQRAPLRSYYPCEEGRPNKWVKWKRNPMNKVRSTINSDSAENARRRRKDLNSVSKRSGMYSLPPWSLVIAMIFLRPATPLERNG